MRVAIVALACPPGRVLQDVSLLVGALAGLCEVHLFSEAHAGLAALLHPQVEFQPIARLSRPNQPVRNCARQLNWAAHAVTAKRIRGVQPDVVHVVTEHACNALLLPLLGDLPLVFNDPEAPRRPSPLQSLRVLSSMCMVEHARAVVVRRPERAAVLEAKGVTPARLAVIPAGQAPWATVAAQHTALYARVIAEARRYAPVWAPPPRPEAERRSA